MFNAKITANDIINWIRSYFNENGRGCHAVIGISGGKDSSAVATLCTKALGKDKVYGVLMPQGVQHDINISHDLVEYLGIEHSVINIGDIIDSTLASIEKVGVELSNQAKVNTPARLRMTVLYAVSASINGRVANTCNLSEDWVGYSTKYGDGAGDFSPLSQLTVKEVIAVGRELGLPDKFINKIPEDGLTGLTDEENLGFSYEILDKYIREGICEDETIKEKIDRLHELNLHKLNPIPSFILI